jgi:Stress responsive A/B Barrel Domain
MQSVGLAHMVYFTLNESTPANADALVAACHKYLSGHPGTLYFSVGKLNPDLKRPVNDTGYDVALNVVFKDMAAHDAYQIAPRHLDFVKENKANWKSVRVCDSDLF